MRIRIDPHTRQRAEERGTNEREIIDVLQTGHPISVKYGYRGKSKIYDFKKEYQDKFYAQKKVDVIYVVEENAITTVTVYVFYGKWEV